VKRFLLVLALCLIINPVMAKNVKVEALSSFSTANPSSTWKIKIKDNFIMEDGTKVRANTIIEGKVVEVSGPKSLKRNATFKFVPVKYYDPKDDKVKNVKRDFEGKYSSMSEINAKTVAKKGAVTAGNMLIGSFVAPAVGLVEGAVKNEKGNRAKSAVVSAYESTPLSYASKGKNIEIKQGQVFIMSFKQKKEEVLDEPNYTYEMAK
jgi:hypothetical protein